jgi:hypothetical protein
MSGGSAKVTFSQETISAIIPSLGSVSIGTVINADWGPINPELIASQPSYVATYSTPNNAKGSSWNGAELLLSTSSSVYITRAIHNDAMYAAALVRFKTLPVDFNDYLAPGTMPDTIIYPLAGGLSLTAAASYQFPQYSTTATFENTGTSVLYSVTSSNMIEASSATDSLLDAFVIGDRVTFDTSPTNSSPLYTITNAQTVSVTDEVVNLSGTLTGTFTPGTEVKKWVSGSAVSYSPNIYLAHDAVSTNSIVVTYANGLTTGASDNILNGDLITLSGLVSTVAVTTKTLVVRNSHQLTFNTPVTVSAGTILELELTSDLEYRDAFLVQAIYPGALGDNIQLGIKASTNYSNAFIVNVYFKGVLKESFEVTRDNFTDGFGNQMQIETAINGISNYITVIDNTQDLARSIPLPTTYGVWQQDPTDIFTVTAVTTVENVLMGDINIAVSNSTTFTNGTRLKFSPTGPQYTVIANNTTTNIFTVDRQVIETSISIGTSIYTFNAALNTPLSGIYNGVQYYKFTQIASLVNYSIGQQYSISNVAGEILDAGTNSLSGGSDGSAITIYDVITAFNKMNNPEQYQISLFLDNGFVDPAIDIALDALVQYPVIAHAYNSVPYTAEISANPDTAAISYRNSTNLDSGNSSLFSGWIEVSDTYNQTKVWVAPSVFGVLSQSFVTQNYYMFTPAAGWVYGRVNGLKIAVQYTEPQRDNLINSQINPIRYREGWGLAVWGNETLAIEPSPVQLRSVAMLLIILKYGLQKYLEFTLFGLNNKPTWTETENAVSLFIRDTLYTTGGVYAYQVSVSSIITPTQIANRIMPIFVGIQPTMDIKTIPVTLGIFSNNVTIAYPGVQ